MTPRPFSNDETYQLYRAITADKSWYLTALSLTHRPPFGYTAAEAIEFWARRVLWPRLSDQQRAVIGNLDRVHWDQLALAFT